jgi:hypothetical protein
MSSLFESRVAAGASSVNDMTTTGQVARANEPATYTAGDLQAAASGTKYSGGRRRRSSKNTSSKRKMAKKTSSRRRRRSSKKSILTSWFKM